MAALEAALVVRTSVDSYLFCWIDSLVTANTFISGSHKLIQHGSLTVNEFLWFHYFGCPFKALVQATSSFKELVKVWSAVQNPFKRIVIAQLESSPAVVAPEAGFVVDPVISS